MNGAAIHVKTSNSYTLLNNFVNIPQFIFICKKNIVNLHVKQARVRGNGL